MHVKSAYAYEFTRKAALSGVPESCARALLRYVLHGVEMGGFMMAIVSNDLFGAFGRADVHNKLHIDSITKFIYNHCPCGCHGSKEKVQKWLDMGGLFGKNSE